MNIPASTLSYMTVLTSSFPMAETQKKQETEASKGQMTQEERMIEQFRREHDPQKERIQQLYGKFRAGKELSMEELDFLAEYSPETYQEIREIIQEREALERQMEQAETKQQVAAVHLNELTHIKETMGTGSQEKSQAMKNMARVNQMDSAHMEYTATVEYREKEDEESQALEQREKLMEEELEQLEASGPEEEGQELSRLEGPEEEGQELSRLEGSEEGREPAQGQEAEKVQGEGGQPKGPQEAGERQREEQLKQKLGQLRQDQEKTAKRRKLPQEEKPEWNTGAAMDLIQLRLKVRNLYRTPAMEAGRGSKGIDILM